MGVKASDVAVHDAATVMLVRDAPGLEVFMVRRNPRSVFVPGAYVFPGGRVDQGDVAAPILDRATGVEREAADAVLGTDAARRFWVAAVRESFEEAGVLLARARIGHAVFAPTDAARTSLARERTRLLAGETDLPAVLDAHDAVLDLGALVPFARWITPEGAPRRFDTWFFVAPAPDGHAYEHDDDEMVASEWLHPDHALERARAGDIELIYPTIRSLLVMRRYPSSAAFLAAARERWNAPGALRVMDVEQGWQLDLTSDAEHRADNDASSFVLGMERAGLRASRAAVGG